MTLLLAWLAASLAAGPAVAGPAPAPTAQNEADPVAIVGGTVWTLEAGSAPIAGATVLIRDGKIIAVGKDIEIPAKARRIDATGKIVTPGFVDAATHLGLVEIDLVASTVDFRTEDPGAIHAAFRAVDGINPQSTLIPITRMEGVTSVLAKPEGGIVAGQSAWIRLAGRRVDEMTILAPSAMHAVFGEASRGEGGKSRAGALRRLREALEDARLLRARPGALDENRMRALSAGRLDLIALYPVLDGKVPLVIDVNSAADIQAALRFAREEKLKVVLSGVAEGWKVAPEIAAAKIPVLVDGMTNLPGSFELLGARYDNAALLDAAGIPVALVSGDAHNVRRLRQQAGIAVANGLSRDKAMAAITRVPAEIFGVADKLGTLSRGKLADVVVWSGDPFEFSSGPTHVFIEGREIPLRSRQTELLDRYRKIPK